MKSLSLIFLFLLSITSYTFASDTKEIGWDDLIPWTSVFDPSEIEFNENMNNKDVKIPGYLVPLEFEGQEVHEFLLVPYIGACIHVPPPPPNQIIYVMTAQPWSSESMWDPVWVSGIININSQETYLAEVGYELIAYEVEFYDY